MKATEQYLLVVGHYYNYAVEDGLSSESVDKMLSGVTIQMKAKEQYFPVALFIRCF